MLPSRELRILRGTQSDNSCGTTKDNTANRRASNLFPQGARLVNVGAVLRTKMTADFSHVVLVDGPFLAGVVLLHSGEEGVDVVQQPQQKDELSKRRIFC